MLSKEEMDILLQKGDVGKEWRSYKEFGEYLDGNRECREFKIIGWVTASTRYKWFKEDMVEFVRKCGCMRKGDAWILCKGKSYWFVFLFGGG